VARLFGQRSLRGLPVPRPGGLGLCPRRCQTWRRPPLLPAPPTPNR